MNWLKNTLNNANQALSAKFGNAKTVSDYYETGEITPQEFIETGDKLINTNAIWKWRKAENEALENKSLNPERQFLSANIPVIKNTEKDKEGDVVMVSDGDWVTFEQKVKEKKLEEEVKAEEKKEAPEQKKVGTLDDSEEESTEQKPTEVNKNKRIYELNITYDPHYHCARLWLSGVDYKGDALTKEQIFEEVMSEYKDKTMTFENHPHLKKQMASLHPCKHAAVIKQLLDQAKSNGKVLPKDIYLFIFLKFINSVMPALPVDYTTEIQL